MCISFLKTERGCRVDTSVHANDDSDFSSWWKGEMTFCKGVGVFVICFFKFFCDGHDSEVTELEVNKGVKTREICMRYI